MSIVCGIACRARFRRPPRDWRAIMTAFALNQADLAFVLKQIKIAEAHANGAALTEIRLTAAGEVITDASQYHPETGAFLGDVALPRAIPDPHVPNGLR